MTANVQAQPDTRLAQLLAQYDLAKAEADKAAEALKTITNAIKLEATQAAEPGSTEIIVDSPELARPLQVSYVERWTVDTKKLKAEAPETYVRYAKKGGSWTLRAVAASS